MQKITPCLWFDNQAEEAMNFYVSVFKNSKGGRVTHYMQGAPAPEGSVMTSEFTLNGQDFMGLNAGPEFKFTEAVSFSISCEDQEETDYYWEKLCEGGQPSQCGWLKDKFGLSWQVIPKQLPQLFKNSDPEKAGRVMQAMMQMSKIDVATLEAAANG